MKILLTGGAGFIGSHIAELYTNKGHEVFILDNFSSGNINNLTFPQGNAKIIQADICNAEDMQIILDKYGPFDIINHQAAHVSVSESMRNPEHDIHTNIIGTLNVLSIASDCKRFIFASSGGTVYGSHSTPRSISDETNPESIYGISKLACEKLVLAKAKAEDFDPVILRYSNVYGPKQSPHGEAGVVSIFMNAIITRNICKIYGDGEYMRDYIHVDDVVRANDICLESSDRINPDFSSKGIFNISTGITLSTNHVYNVISELMVKHNLVEGSACEYLPHRTGDIRYSCCIPTSELSDWKPTIDFTEGIFKTLSDRNCFRYETNNAHP